MSKGIASFFFDPWPAPESTECLFRIVWIRSQCFFFKVFYPYHSSHSGVRTSGDSGRNLPLPGPDPGRKSGSFHRHERWRVRRLPSSGETYKISVNWKEVEHWFGAWWSSWEKSSLSPIVASKDWLIRDTILRIFCSHRIRVLITYKLADFSHNKIRLLYTGSDRYTTIISKIGIV